MKWKGRVRNGPYKLENDLPNYVFDGGVNYVKVVVSDCDPMGCSLLGSSVHGILQGRILEGVSCHFSKGFSQPRN